MKLSSFLIIVLISSVGCAGTTKRTAIDRKVAQNSQITSESLVTYLCEYHLTSKGQTYKQEKTIYATDINTAISIYATALTNNLQWGLSSLVREDNVFKFKSPDGAESPITIICNEN